MKKTASLLKQVTRRMSKLMLLRPEPPTVKTLQEITNNNYYLINVPPRGRAQWETELPVAEAVPIELAQADDEPPPTETEALRAMYGEVVVSNTNQRNIKRMAKGLMGIPPATNLSILQIYTRFVDAGGDTGGLGALSRGDSNIAYGFFSTTYPL